MIKRKQFETYLWLELKARRNILTKDSIGDKVYSCIYAHALKDLENLIAEAI